MPVSYVCSVSFNVLYFEISLYNINLELKTRDLKGPRVD